ncbi:DUF6084 family protein [Gordonia sp. SL306]|uniref:DUF6084 family protein n=1 Tax=Gordonia sp. SL306 TaxID=2995145 RepID=UPI00226E66C9|nr:DUF6084 family protein [Gordonia sp. SL306]WAC53713.1 DUF6084 family protein [Gordonia sp. SL306]
MIEAIDDIDIRVIDVSPEPYALSPTLIARTQLTLPDGAGAHAVALRAQVRIEPTRRPYTDAEAAGLVDLFGLRERWSATQRAFLWMHSTTMVPGFTGDTVADLPLPCTYDFEVSASKYLHALADGAIPLLFLFSGTVFVKGTPGLTVQQIPWDREARFELPVRVWRDLMAMCHPGTGWLRLRGETISALTDYKSAHGLLDYDEAVTALLSAAVAR